MTTTFLAWALVLLLFPLVLLLWATETREQRIRRLRGYGHSQAAIARQLGTTQYQVRKALKG